jgi:hypothetical protein
VIAIAVLVPLGLVAVLVSLGGHGRDRRIPSLRPAPVAQAPRDSTRARPGAGGAGEAAALAAGIAIGLLALGAVVVRDHRGRRHGLPDEARATMAGGARDALAAIGMPSDPRAGVLVAYARMQAALDDAGLARSASEAPREYLDRLAARLGVAREPAARLTGLFERARFSRHPIDEAMRSSAIAALERIRDGLEVDRR